MQSFAYAVSLNANLTSGTQNIPVISQVSLLIYLDSRLKKMRSVLRAHAD